MSLARNSLSTFGSIWLKAGVVGVVVLTSVACSKSSSDQEISQSPNAAPQSVNQQAAPATAPVVQPVADLTAPPTVEVPKEIFAPSAEELQSSFADVLVKTVSEMPDTPERATWYQQQVNILQTLVVHSCTATPVGTPSTCRVTVNNQSTNVNVLLTQSGWVLVK